MTRSDYQVMEKGAVVYLEDSFIVRQGLRNIVHERFGASLIFESITSRELCEVWPDICLYDCIIIGSISDNVEVVIDKIKKQNKSVQIIVFPKSLHYLQALNYLSAGADSYLTQCATSEEIVQALQYCLTDRRYLSRELLEQLAKEVLNNNFERKKNNITSNLSTAPFLIFKTLSNRQMQIVKLLVQGESISMIARRLDLSTSTVSTHKAVAYKKLCVSSLRELAGLCYDAFMAR